MNKYIAEAVGTFGLVFCGTGAIIINEVTSGTVTHLGIAATFGLIVLSMIFAVGDISGAHLNPAVTIGFWVSGRFPRRAVFPYITSQLIGALIASTVLKLLFPENSTLGATTPLGPAIQSFILETILTFLLILVIMSVSTGSKEKGALAGIAVGSVILLEAAFAGPISGASMNPARSLAPAVISGNYQHLWVYLFAPILGAILAVFVWQLITEKERTSQ